MSAAYRDYLTKLSTEDVLVELQRQLNAYWHAHSRDDTHHAYRCVVEVRGELRERLGPEQTEAFYLEALATAKAERQQEIAATQQRIAATGKGVERGSVA